MKPVLTRPQVLELINKIIVAEVAKLEKHEGADSLWIVQLDLGQDEPVQVVTASTNIKEGDLVPFLGAGEKVPGPFFKDGEEFVLEARKMRGAMSNGMVLAEDEIGVGEDHDGILILGTGKLGAPIAELLSDEQLQFAYDLVDAIEITPELQEKIDLIMSIATHGGEVVGEEDLPAILSSGEKLYTYDGFEPSGQMHIAQGIIRAINTNKMIKAGFTFRMWVADWFGYLNNKMGGDLDKIKKVGEYFIEIWRASGMDLDNTEFLWTSDHVGEREYWETVMRISKHTTLNRILRTTEIMGRSETDALSAAQILYPAMQTTDIFKVMKCQVTQLGMDQRKVNMLAREVGPELGFWKPVVVSHGMLQGLGKPVDSDVDPTERAIAMKMSKSKPDTAIFMTDTREDIERKIMKAYCPEGEVADNPVLDYCKQIIFEAYHLKRDPILNNGKFEVKREDQFGGNVSYSSYAELEEDYKAKNLFPLDLKNAVIGYLDELVKPVREHFENDGNAKALLEEVRSYQVTR